MDGTTSIRPAEYLNASNIATFLFCGPFTDGEVVMTDFSVLSTPDPYPDNSNKLIYKRHFVLQAVDGTPKKARLE